MTRIESRPVLDGYPGLTEIDRAQAFLQETDPAFREAPPNRKPMLANAWLKSQTSAALANAEGPMLLSAADQAQTRDALDQLMAAIREALDARDMSGLVDALKNAKSVIDRLLSFARAAAPEAAPEPAKLTDPGVRNKVLMGCAGHNLLEKAVSYLDARDPEFAALPWHRKVWTAGRFCNTGKVEIEK